MDLIGNSDVTIRDYGTIVHKHKLVLELMQRGFPTNRPPWWLALYGYLQHIERVKGGGGATIANATTSWGKQEALARQKAAAAA